MKIEVINQKDNPLLKRKEFNLAVDYEKGAVASKAAISEFLQKNFSVVAENIEVVKISTDYGITKGKARARIWEGPAPKPKEKKKSEGAPAK